MCSFVLSVFIFYLLVLSGCAPAMIDKSFKGKVINGETKEPIEGAVALAIWTTWMMTPAGETTDYFDIYETETDINGEFHIPGKGTRVATNLNPMQITVLKAGYMESKGTLESYSKNPKTKDGKIIIRLKKLTSKQKRMRGTGPASPPIEAPQEKVEKYLHELNNDRIERGLSPIKY